MFDSLSKNYLLPENFIIAGNPSIVPLFCECIHEKDVSKMTRKHEPLTITVLLPEYLERFIRSKTGDKLDTFLSMSSVYVAKLISSNYKNSLKILAPILVVIREYFSLSSCSFISTISKALKFLSLFILCNIYSSSRVVKPPGSLYPVAGANAGYCQS